jgi:hypothetical protein
MGVWDCWARQCTVALALGCWRASDITAKSLAAKEAQSPPEAEFGAIQAKESSLSVMANATISRMRPANFLDTWFPVVAESGNEFGVILFMNDDCILTRGGLFLRKCRRESLRNLCELAAKTAMKHFRK